MFSRPGCQTIADYICFKEPHDIVQEKDEFMVMLEEDKRQQVVNDLNAQDTNVFSLRVEREQAKAQKERELMAKQKDVKPDRTLHEQGVNGNTSMFRGEPRYKKNMRDKKY